MRRPKIKVTFDLQPGGTGLRTGARSRVIIRSNTRRSALKITFVMRANALNLNRKVSVAPMMDYTDARSFC